MSFAYTTHQEVFAAIGLQPFARISVTIASAGNLAVEVVPSLKKGRPLKL